MFELITVFNLVLASFMVGNDYDSIAAYQDQKSQAEEVVVLIEQDEDGVSDLES